MIKIATAVVIGSVAAVAVAPSAHAQSTVIGMTSSSAKVSAYGGRVLWSTPFDGRGGRRYRLMQRYEGRTRPVDVPTKAWRAFDVDVGPDGHGGASAVYSRCRDEFSHRGCDLYRFNLRQGAREHPLRKLNTSADEQLPTIWGRRIAFARGSSIVNVQLRIANLRTGSSKRVRGGSPPVTSTSGGRGPLKTGAHRGSGPVTLELAGDRLAFTWDTIPAQCPGESTSNIDPDAATNTSREVWASTLSTPSRRLTAGCENGQESFFDGLTWFGDQLGLSVLKPSDALRYRLSFQLHSVDGTLLREALLPDVAALPPTAYDGRYVYFRAASTSSDRSELRRAPFLARQAGADTMPRLIAFR